MQHTNKSFEALLEEYVTGTITDGDRSLLMQMASQSAQYREDFNKASKLHALLSVPAIEAQKAADYSALKQRMNGLEKKKNTSFRLSYLLSGAAAIALMILSSVATYYIMKPDRQVVSQTSALCEVIVPMGCQTQLLLPDSTSVTLNAGTIFKYPSNYGETNREVYLNGEGYFVVAKDEDVPFIVNAGVTRIEVTGTIFNVSDYPDNDNTVVNLIEGSVDVMIKNQDFSLMPDEKVVFNKTSGKAEKKLCDSSKAALWTTGKLSFVNASFIDILKSIERKYNIKIQVNTTKLTEERFSGTINPDMTLQEVFNFIDVDRKYRFELSGNTILLKDR